MADESPKQKDSAEWARPGIAFMLVGTLCAAYIYGVYQDRPVVSAEGMFGLVGAVIAWLYKARDDEKRRDSDRKDAVVAANTAAASTTEPRSTITAAPGSTIDTTVTPPPGGIRP